VNKIISWFKDLFKQKPPVIVKREVGLARIEILEGDNVHSVSMIGYTDKPTLWTENRVFFHDVTAEDLFWNYRKLCGQTGLVSLANGNYIPLCNVKKISVEYEPHEVEIKIPAGYYNNGKEVK